MAGMIAQRIRSCFGNTKKGVRLEVDNAKTRKGLFLGLHLFMRSVSGRAIYEKENLNKLGKWVRERQQEKWIVAEIQKISRLAKPWSVAAVIKIILFVSLGIFLK
jgi:hypothetical protein